jgi:hypothetical protein
MRPPFVLVRLRMGLIGGDERPGKTAYGPTTEQQQLLRPDCWRRDVFGCPTLCYAPPKPTDGSRIWVFSVGDSLSMQIGYASSISTMHYQIISSRIGIRGGCFPSHERGDAKICILSP